MAELGYESALPDDIQYGIMERFVVHDPRTALRLASASPRQAAMLESFRDRLIDADAMLQRRDDSPSTAADHVRASLALARRSGRIDRRAVLAGVAQCLMEAFARLLLEYPDPAYERLLGTPDPAGVVERVAKDPRLGGALDRVAAWYAWITSPYDDPFAGQPPDPISWLIDIDPDLAGHGGGGHFDRDTVETWRQSMRDPDAVIAIGSWDANEGFDTAAGSVKGIDGIDGIDGAIPLWAFHGPDGARRLAALLGGSVTPLDLVTWSRGHDDGRVRATLESRDAEMRLVDTIDDAVAARLEGPCADPSGSGRLGLPPFSWLFDMRFFLVAAPDATVLMASLWSPVIEADLLS
ncbi:hypothetical protein pkur_cds_366 [Pandoravirus kuranda]|uniref:Uncharacterized protein n=1 Tax=Pandoravirus kuranda TaxID=3019033 RepID=A0AA95ECJ2_9VIRU|nr:hypothetical protein pkur_cds_366 [Pandoravirus kuranda]